LLRENPDKIDWQWLTTNPAIFRDTYMHNRQSSQYTDAQSPYRLLEDLRW